ncbi:replication protein [Campylobacter coli]|nr:replication protein [Campylobacter coli]NQM50012.1 protein rep [Streptococcus suis]
MKIINLGILAHVDAGKTTLTESLLYTSGAIVETAKYPTKPIEKMGKTEEQKLKVTDDLMKALKNKRQIGFGGLFKEIRKELQLDDVERGDLIHIDDENQDVSMGVEIVAIWNWERKNYFIKE